MQQQTQVQTRQIEYKDRHAMQQGIQQMATRGWQVSATMETHRQRSILARLMWLPWKATKGKAHYVVTYTSSNR
jgi:hypothetical protein